MDLILQRSENSKWPVQADLGQNKLVFAGYLESSRVASSSAVASAIKLQKTLAGVGLGAGIISLIVRALLNLDNLGLSLIVGHSILLGVFWFGILCGLYLWALFAHDREKRMQISELLKIDSSSEEFDVFKFFTPESEAAWNSIANLNNPNIPVEEVLAQLLQTDAGSNSFYRLGQDPNEAVALIAANKNNFTQKMSVAELPFAALFQALTLKNNAIDPQMLILAIIKNLPQEHFLNRFFFEKGIEIKDIEAVCVWTFNVRLIMEQQAEFGALAKLKSSGQTNTGLTAVPTKYLDQFSKDLTLAAKFRQLPVSIGREQDLANLEAMMSDRLVNIVIKGEEGSGRTSVINSLAQKMVTEEVPVPLQDKRLVKLEISSIVGGQLPAEQILVEALNEAAISGNIVLVVEEIDMLARVRGQSGLSLLSQLLNIVQQGGVSIIATTTPERFITDIENEPNFSQMFTSYELSDLDETSILSASCIKASFLESQHGVIFLFSTIKEAFNLSQKYIKDQNQPAKTIALLAEAAAKHVGPDKIVAPEDIQTVIAEKTHVPTEAITQNEGDKLVNLEAEIGKHVIGQKDAVVAVAEALRRARSGLSSGQRPLASFLFVGPTGVGKTELARTLTSVYFSDEKFLLRLDMSEYQGEGGINKLLGTPSAPDTAFTTHLQNYPFCLFLLDEFEKASPAVINLFLQVLEDGRITTASGQTLDATQSIIIATSNAGTKQIQAGLSGGESLESIKSRLVNEILLEHYAPELLNRFDGVILFTPLSPDEVKQIASLRLNNLAAMLLEKGYEVGFSGAVIEKIAAEAYDPLLGARPIRRYIQDNVESVMAKLILSGQVSRGLRVLIDLDSSGQISAQVVR